MKNNSRGNYRILYRDLHPSLLYNHFRIIAEQEPLLASEGLDRVKALKAVREMGRVHFAEVEPDGFVDGKKAWFGHRWNVLYRQWGNYLSEREQAAESAYNDDASQDEAGVEHAMAAQTVFHVREQEGDEAASFQKPAQPPTAFAGLAKVDEDDQGTRNTGGRSSFLRWFPGKLPFHPALNGHGRKAAISLGLLILAAVFVVFRFSGPLPSEHQSQLLLSSAQGMMVDQDFAVYREHLAKGGDGPNSYRFEDLEETVAVFATQESPFVLIQDRSVRINDFVALGSHHGIVSDIRWDRLTLKTQKGPIVYPFPAHVMMGQPTYESGDVVVYPTPANLNGVLAALARVNRWDLEIGENHHSISGKFESIHAFNNACRQLDVAFQPGKVKTPDAEKPKSFISFGGFWYEPSGPIPSLIDMYAPHLSLPVKVEGSFSQQFWVLNYGLQFEEFCNYFNLRTEIRDNHIIVKGGSNEQGNVGN